MNGMRFVVIWFLLFVVLLQSSYTDEVTNFKILSKTSIPAKNVEVDVSFRDVLEENGKKFGKLMCDITAKHFYSQAEVRINLVGVDVKGYWNSVQVIPLAKGYNSCTFLLPLVGMEDGKYSAKLEVKYTREEKPAVVDFQVEKISAEGLENELRMLKGKFDEITKGGVRLSEVELVKRLFLEAERELEEKKWEELSDSLNTLEEEIKTLQVSFLRVEDIVEPDYEGLLLTDGGFRVGDKPICAVGVYIDGRSMGEIEELVSFHPPFVVLSLGLDDLLPVESEVEDLSLPDSVFSGIGKILDSGVPVLIQLNQRELPNWLLEKYPEINSGGFVNLAHGYVHQLLEKCYQELIKRFGERKNYLGTILFVNPQFKFDGEGVRKAFVEWVMKNYPDRQLLNQVWHAHLASYDEITIWDEFAPKWSYQNKRAYQYDWQNFHRVLISDFLREFVSRVKQVSDKPVAISLPASVFEVDETRFTGDREKIVPYFDFVSLNMSINMYDSVYAQSYPDPVVDIVWANSVFRNKHLVVSRVDFNFVGDVDANEKYNRVRNALWEFVISGAELVAVNLSWQMEKDLSVWKAIMDANRFFYKYGREIREFQLAKPDVSVIFSDSSKILDGGIPHLKSAKMAYEGSSFAGYKIGFATENLIKMGVLDEVNVAIMPQILALEDEVFNLLSSYVESGKHIIRVGTQIPYDPRGVSRRDVVQPSGNTVLVRGMNLPTEYLYGMDAVISKKALRPVPRPVNKTGYPIEGIKSRFIPTEDGGGYLYLASLRKDSVVCRLDGYLQKGKNLIDGAEIEFPRVVNPLEIIFVKLYPPKYEAEVKQVEKTVEKGRR